MNLTDEITDGLASAEFSFEKAEKDLRDLSQADKTLSRLRQEYAPEN